MNELYIVILALILCSTVLYAARMYLDAQLQKSQAFRLLRMKYAKQKEQEPNEGDISPDMQLIVKAAKLAGIDLSALVEGAPEELSKLKKLIPSAQGGGGFL